MDTDTARAQPSPQLELSQLRSTLALASYLKYCWLEIVCRLQQLAPFHREQSELRDEAAQIDHQIKSRNLVFSNLPPSIQSSCT